MRSKSSAETTEPAGFEGEFKMMALVFGVSAARKMSPALRYGSLYRREVSGTSITRAPHACTMPGASGQKGAASKTSSPASRMDRAAQKSACVAPTPTCTFAAVSPGSARRPRSSSAMSLRSSGRPGHAP